MRAIFLADGKIFTTGFSRMSERQLALWDTVRGCGGPSGGCVGGLQHGAAACAALTSCLLLDQIPKLDPNAREASERGTKPCQALSVSHRQTCTMLKGTARGRRAELKNAERQ